MGCDIHGIVQLRRDKDHPYDYVGQIEDQRNYTVFAMLGGLRGDLPVDDNGKTTRPISEARGLPKDLELVPEPLAEHDYAVYKHLEFGQVWLGEHTFTWLTLTEILRWPGWDQNLRMTSEIPREEYERIIREGGPPQSFRKRDPFREVAVDEKDIGTIDSYTHVRYSWLKPYIEETIVFLKWLEYLYAKYERYLKVDPDAVRIVFGFDN